MRSVEFHPEAQSEFISAAQFYERQTRGLGLDFITTGEHAYARLLEFPVSGPLFGRRLRRLLVPKFPTASCIASSPSAFTSWQSCTFTVDQATGGRVSKTRPVSDGALGGGPTVTASPSSTGSDPAGWAQLRSAEACVICRRGAPDDIVAQLETSWVTVDEDAPMRGYACLVFRRHAVELHDLSETEGAAFMRDVRRLSAALQEVTGAVKLNYEVHGNTLPHLHMHFFPRYPGDPFGGGRIDRRVVGEPVYAPREIAALRMRLREALGGAREASPGPPPR